MSWNYYASPSVRAYGISSETPDMRDLIITGTPNRQAFCASQKCAGTAIKRGVRKKVVRDAEVCPDCGHYLNWKVNPRNPKEPKPNEQN